MRIRFRSISVQAINNHDKEQNSQQKPAATLHDKYNNTYVGLDTVYKIAGRLQ